MRKMAHLHICTAAMHKLPVSALHHYWSFVFGMLGQVAGHDL
jgi:hypothetical protein